MIWPSRNHDFRVPETLSLDILRNFFALHPIIYGGGKFTPTKVILFALFQAAYGVEKSSKVCEPITVKILSNFYPIWSIFLEVMTMLSRRYPKNRGISLYLLIKNRKITKTVLKWAKTVKTNTNFHQRTKIIRIFEFQIFFGSITRKLI